MTLYEIIIIAISLAMDAFAVSLCKGMSLKKYKFSSALKIGIYFGLFQGLMPLIGYFLGNSFASLIEQIDHWIAFILLSAIGISMIRESFNSEEIDDKIDFKNLIILAIATSIDALAVGITFAFLNVNIIISALLIGIITFVLSFVGVKIGNRFETKLQNKAQIFGGIVLILIGLKILFEHLNILNF